MVVGGASLPPPPSSSSASDPLRQVLPGTVVAPGVNADERRIAALMRSLPPSRSPEDQRSRLLPHQRLSIDELPAKGNWDELAAPHVASFDFFLDTILPSLGERRPPSVGNELPSVNRDGSASSSAGGSHHHQRHSHSASQSVYGSSSSVVGGGSAPSLAGSMGGSAARSRVGSRRSSSATAVSGPGGGQHKDAASWRYRLQTTIDLFPEGAPSADSAAAPDSDGAGGVEYQRVTLSLSNLRVQRPEVEDKAGGKATALMPGTCRQAGLTYDAPLFADVRIVIETKNKGSRHLHRTEKVIQKRLGSLPVMTRSRICRLRGLTPAQLVRAGEEPHEFGGYFIVNGNEKVIRLLIAPRRNEVQGIARPTFTRIGRTYTKFATQIRCVRSREQTSITLTMHYCSDGLVTVRFILGRQEFFIPLVILLRALVDGVTDREIYEKVVLGAARGANNSSTDSSVADSIELLLRETKKLGVFERSQALEYLGARFRFPLKADAGLIVLEGGKVARADMSPEIKKLTGLTDRAVGQQLLDDVICVHLDNNHDKFELLLFMYEKLLALVHGRCAIDNPDAAMNHEVYLPGHLYGIFLQEKLQEYLYSLRAAVLRPFRTTAPSAKSSKARQLVSVDAVSAAFDKTIDVGQKVRYFLATGNILSDSGLDLMQTSGFTIIAEKLNFLRYLSHYRSIHRGAFFTTMRTTAVRKLLPEGWGFLCPVHTPDGGPCGLLNHLANKCSIVQNEVEDDVVQVELPRVLRSLGMEPLRERSAGAISLATTLHADRVLTVIIDGRPVGWLPLRLASEAAATLRLLKVRGERSLPSTLEIALVLPTTESGNEGGRYPGLFLATTPARMMRPVRHLHTNLTEMIGILEQVYLSVACVPEDLRGADDTDPSTHMELSPTNMLAVVSSLTPFSDFNQSPRNMYQCQMGKQTMATPMHSYVHRTDNKLYRIQTPQVPLCRTRNQDAYKIDEYPTGCNAIVAVISYTGYDMEDAMIINKSSYERGFGHGSVYKTEIIRTGDAETGRSRRTAVAANDTANPRKYFHNSDDPSDPSYQIALDDDGLVRPGTRLFKGDPVYSELDERTGEYHVHRWKSSEPCVVDQVRILSSNGEHPDAVSIKYRFNRNPVIGDKFSSRHGQKGVLSHLWPEIDMPFSESGMTPDCIINPHAFPSRMTIGMLVESLAGKAGALHGIFQDATPFSFDEERRAGEYFGEQLAQAGFNYYGNEVMYSGTTGLEFKADIYLGAVYYQRLRHMVKDKFQVRSTGPINPLTQQPIKGRKRGGGVRFGEMERDSLLSHGVSFLLHDRLMNCSDAGKAYCCGHCGSILTPTNMKIRKPGIAPSSGRITHARETTQMKITCRNCMTSSNMAIIALPFVFRYLATELAAMNIKMSLTLTPE